MLTFSKYNPIYLTYFILGVSHQDLYDVNSNKAFDLLFPFKGTSGSLSVPPPIVGGTDSKSGIVHCFF